jgi:WD40 repeat protein/formylglycine-generating enzyme required for sulfatase activity/tetratricopeptide (TPR) repeat protein
MTPRNPLFFSVVLLSFLLPSPMLSGMDDAEMKRISSVISTTYQDGERLYEEGSYKEARDKLSTNFAFEESVKEIEKDYSTLEDFKKSGVYYDFINSYLYAGRSSVRLNDPANALSYYASVQARVPFWTEIYREIGDVHAAQDDIDAEIATWELCIRSFTNPPDLAEPQIAWVPAEPYERIGALSLGRGDFARAIDCGEKALGIVDEERSLPLMNAGLAALLAGDPVKAARFYMRAVEDVAPKTQPRLGGGVAKLRAMYMAPQGTRADPLASFFLWALAESAGDGKTADESVARIASDAKGADQIDSVAAGAQLDPGSSYILARFFCVSRNARAAVAWLKRATNDSPGLAILRIEIDPRLSYLKTSIDYRKAFGGTKEPIVTPDYYAAIEQAAPYEIVVQDRHHKIITGAATSPDGKFIVTSSGDRRVKMWTLDGILLKSFKSDRGLSCVAYSPTGRFIVAGTEEGSVRLWTVDGKEEKKLEGPAFPLDLVTVSPDGRYIAASSNIMGSGDDYAVRLWSRDGRYLRSYVGHSGIVRKVAFSPDGQYLASLADDGDIRLWDVVSGQCMTVISSAGEDRSLQGFAFPRSGGGILVWEYPLGVSLRGFDGKPIRNIVDATDTIRDLSISADGKTILALCANDALRSWTVEGKAQSTITFVDESVHSAFFTPDSQKIIAWTIGKSYENAIHLYDRAGSLLRSFPISSPLLVHADMSSDGSHAVSIDTQGAIRLWRADGKLLKTFTELTGKLDSARFSQSGDRIVVSDHGNNRLGEYNVNASIWDLNGNLLKLFGTWYGVSASVSTLEGSAGRDRDARFFPDGSHVLLSGSESVHTYDVNGNVAAKSIPRDVWDTSISGDGKRIALVGNGFGEIWDASGTLIQKFPCTEQDYPSEVAIRPDGQSVAFAYSRELRVYSVSGALAWARKTGEETITAVCWSQDGKTIATCSRDTTISLWTAEGNLLRTLRGHRDTVLGVKFVKNDSLLFSYSDDSTMGIWNVQTGDHYFIASSGGEWIAFTDDGYFDCSRNGGTIVAVVKGFTAYGVDQFALSKNRPDVLLTRTGLGSPDQISHYLAQFRRRIAKIAPLPASIPLALFEKQILPSASTPALRTLLLATYGKGKESYVLKGAPSYAERLSLISLPAYARLIEDSLGQKSRIPRVTLSASERSGSALSLSMSMQDPAGSLYRYNLYVNDVPVFGSMGKEVKGKDALVHETIQLSPGTNKIEAVCLNTSLVESYRDRLFVEAPPGEAGNLYVMSFGVSLYKDESLDLNYAHKDAEDLAKLFSTMEGKSFAHVFTKVLVNEQATLPNIAKAKEFLKDARVMDTVVLFIAGHGVHDHDSAATYYYLTYEADLQDLSHSAATFEMLEDLLQEIAPRSKLFLMDTCESGEIDESTQEASLALTGSRGISARAVKKGARGLTITGSATPVTRDYLNDRDRFVYNDLTRRSGAVVFSSCKGGEFSYETDERKNGLFTASLLDALTGKLGDKPAAGTISNGMLAQLVTDGVAKESDDLQHPTVDRDNLTQKLLFPVMSTGSIAPAVSVRAQDSMIAVDGGEMMMGANFGDENQRPAHRVFIDGFLMSAYEVTVGEFREFIQNTGYTTSNEDWKAKSKSQQVPTWNDPLFSRDPSLPVIGVSFSDAVRFCNWLSARRGYSPCYSILTSGEIVADLSKNGFRLPTEAEWEFAASGGGQSRGFTYSGSNRLSDVGWYADNSGYKTHPVGKLSPNELGIFDMSGNAFEWCNDWYNDKGYPDAVYDNPKGPEKGFDRVIRGGCWSVKAFEAAVKTRNSRPFWDMQPCIGIRLARNMLTGDAPTQ